MKITQVAILIFAGLPPWMDIWWPTWLLVAVTAIAVCAALKTLGSINAQVIEMMQHSGPLQEAESTSK